MQPLIKKIEALAISISVQSGIGTIEAVSEKDDTKKAIFQVTAKTPLMTKDGYQIGVSAIPVRGKIIAFVDSQSPLPMLSPPHITPLLIIFDQYDKIGEVCIGAFDQALYCEQLKLKLHLNEATEIVDLTGKRLGREDLAGRMLFVFYDQVTRSLPAQAKPKKIIATDIRYELAQ